MGFQQHVARVEKVRFHPRQVVHPREDFGEFEERIVPAPDQERGRLGALEVIRMTFRK